MQVHRPITVDDLDALELPERWELVQGEVVEASPSGAKSGRIGGRIYNRLLETGERAGKGYAYPAESGFILDPQRTTLVSPDAAFVRPGRLEDPEPSGFVLLAPDIAAEALSPSDRVSSAVQKAGLYLGAGTELVWLVHPERRTVTVFTQDAPPFTLVGDDAVLDGGDVLPEFRMTLAEIFGS